MSSDNSAHAPRNLAIDKSLKPYTQQASNNVDNDSPDSPPEISPSVYDMIPSEHHHHEHHHHEHVHHQHHTVASTDDEQSIELTARASDRQYHLFGNQVAGTLPMLHSDGLLYKPLKTDLEHQFYTNIISWLPSIALFIPKYEGMEYIKIGSGRSGDDEEEDESQVVEDTNDPFNNDWSSQMFKKNRHRIRKMPFLILEDLTLKYMKPNILDLKIGTRHFPPICNANKMGRKLRKSWCSTCRDFGVRMSGIQIFNKKQQKYDIIAKKQARCLEKSAFCEMICEYFAHTTNEILSRFIDKLRQILDILKNEHRFRWFSCSLLFVYEGSEIEREENECKMHDEDHDEAQILKQLDLKIIDFTNFVVLEDYDLVTESDEDDDDSNNKEAVLQLNKKLDNLNEPDHGILFGLQSLLRLLSEMKHNNGAIKTRDEKEWNQFTKAISYSKKALLPFQNKEEFNEQTEI